MNATFMLRKSFEDDSTYKNVQVSLFSPLPQDGRVHVVNAPSPPHGGGGGEEEKDFLLQVYPAHAHKTLYDLRDGECLFVFGLLDKNATDSLPLMAQTKEPDVHVIFQAPRNLVKVVVVVAASLKEANELKKKIL